MNKVSLNKKGGGERMLSEKALEAVIRELPEDEVLRKIRERAKWIELGSHALRMRYVHPYKWARATEIEKFAKKVQELVAKLEQV
jgi:hypothetical protein